MTNGAAGIGDGAAKIAGIIALFMIHIIKPLKPYKRSYSKIREDFI